MKIIDKEIKEVPYNQIDFAVKASKLRIVFSYTDEESLSFVREYLLRLLNMKSCRPEQIANYFGFSQHETLMAIEDLINKKWIQWSNDGVIELTPDGKTLFDKSESNTPKIPILSQQGNHYFFELIGHNFLAEKHIDRFYDLAVELNVDNEELSNCKVRAKTYFQNDFIHYKEENIIKINSDKDSKLYRVDLVEQLGVAYFRFTQRFELLIPSGDQKERPDIEGIKNSDALEQAITEEVHQSRPSNLVEIAQATHEMNDKETLKIFVDNKFNFERFLTLKTENEKKNRSFFLGQIYHQADLGDKIVQAIGELDRKNNEPVSLVWFAPSDRYWGKQKKILNLINLLNNESIKKIKKQTKKLYDFRLYLPLPLEEELQRSEKHQWKHQFRNIENKRNLYGFLEGFLQGNIEVILLENEFAIICYHLILPEYDVSLPVGFFTQQLDEVVAIKRMMDTYLSQPILKESSIFETCDFGSINN